MFHLKFKSSFVGSRRSARLQAFARPQTPLGAEKTCTKAKIRGILHQAAGHLGNVGQNERFFQQDKKMAGFFKTALSKMSEYRAAQKELTEVFKATSGVNFMQMHPQITSYLISVHLKSGSEVALQELDEMMAQISTRWPNLSRKEAQDLLVDMCKSRNNMDS